MVNRAFVEHLHHICTFIPAGLTIISTTLFIGEDELTAFSSPNLLKDLKRNMRGVRVITHFTSHFPLIGK